MRGRITGRQAQTMPMLHSTLSQSPAETMVPKWRISGNLVFGSNRACFEGGMGGVVHSQVGSYCLTFSSNGIRTIPAMHTLVLVDVRYTRFEVSGEATRTNRQVGRSR